MVCAHIVYAVYNTPNQRYLDASVDRQSCANLGTLNRKAPADRNPETSEKVDIVV